MLQIDKDTKKRYYRIITLSISNNYDQTNDTSKDAQLILVPGAGLEPARPLGVTNS